MPTLKTRSPGAEKDDYESPENFDLKLHLYASAADDVETYRTQRSFIDLAERDNYNCACVVRH